jgi:recombination protein RecA
MDANKQKALDAALAQIERQFGKGTVMRMGDRTQEPFRLSPPDRWGWTSHWASAACRAAGRRDLRPGVLRQDHADAVGHRRVPEAGRYGAFIDAEHALDPVYAEKLGVRVEDLIVSQPDTGEQALEIVDMLVRSGAVDVVVVDSVAALCRAPRSRARWATRTSACRRA